MTFTAKDTIELPVEVSYTRGFDGPEEPYRVTIHGVEVPYGTLSYYEQCAVDEIVREDWEAHIREISRSRGGAPWI